MEHEEIADKVGLDSETKKRFCKYMRLRWANEEETQCKYGYSEEWALRFKHGEEFGASDSEGQYILREVMQ